MWMCSRARVRVALEIVGAISALVMAVAAIIALVR